MSCYRCGSCCKDTINYIPKFKESNLNPDFLVEIMEKQGLESLDKYLEEHLEKMGETCKWLRQPTPTDKAECIVYCNRASSCRNYDYDYCNVGFAYWMDLVEMGHKIPTDILEELKKHPLYKQ